MEPAVSEQEAKILMTQLLEERETDFSTETPTKELYVWKEGAAGQSALTDVTAYRSKDPRPKNRSWNIELKEGQKSFDHDVEKLLREMVEGIWFHTLAKATESSWNGIKNKIDHASGLAEMNYGTLFGPKLHSVHFTICVVESGMMRQFDLPFDKGWRPLLEAAFLKPEVPVE